MPDTVQGLIAARLDTLPPHRKALLQDAAVIGKVFWAGALESMDERDEGRAPGPSQPREEGAPAPRAALVRRGPGRVRLLACAHPRRGVRPDPSLSARREALAVADWIEKMAGARLVDHSELLAHHTTEAIALGQASGASRDPELELRAAQYLVLAGDRALELDVGTAVARYTRGFETAHSGV